MRSKQCPFCKQWISLPLRRPEAAFDDHKRACNPDGYKHQREYAAELLGETPPTEEELLAEAKRREPRDTSEDTIKVGLGTLEIMNRDRLRIGRYFDKRGYATRAEVKIWVAEVIRHALRELD